MTQHLLYQVDIPATEMELFETLEYAMNHSAKQPVRGRLTNRRMIGYGKIPLMDRDYYWGDLPNFPEMPEWALGLLDEEPEKWICLCNVYAGGDKIGTHKDTSKYMDTEAGVVSISFGMLKGALLPYDTVLGTMKVDGKNYPIKSSTPMDVPCLYTHAHSATTHKSKCDYRINFTFRKVKSEE